MIAVHNVGNFLVIPKDIPPFFLSVLGIMTGHDDMISSVENSQSGSGVET